MYLLDKSSYVGNPQMVLWMDLPQQVVVLWLVFVAASCVLTRHVGHHRESVPCRTVILVPCAECLEVVEFLRCIITKWDIVFGRSSSDDIIRQNTCFNGSPHHIFATKHIFSKSYEIQTLIVLRFPGYFHMF